MSRPSTLLNPASRNIFALAFALVTTHCDARDPLATSNLELSVAPLTLPGLSRVCYDLEVTNGPGRTGQRVWKRGSLGLSPTGDSDAVCSTGYGNGTGGAVTFVGACDANGAQNSVTLWVDGLYDSSATFIAPGGADGWQDPCPSGCTLNVDCFENQDTKVEFNLTIIRQANQGFFDIGVTFEDIFCSAKLDCVDGLGNELNLLHNPSTGQRGQTAVVAFACTGGPGGPATRLLRDPIEVVCDSSTTWLDPAFGLGNAYGSAPGQVADPNLADPIWQYAVYSGAETLTCGGQSCDKQYWNVAIGFSPTATNCRLRTSASAVEASATPTFETPANTRYPLVTWDVALTSATTPGARVCGKHPLNGLLSGVSTVYTDLDEPHAFATSFDGTNFDKDACPVGYTGASCEIPLSGLLVSLDAGNSASYPGTGSTWFDLSGNGLNGALQGGVAYNTGNGGQFVFDGSNDQVNVTASTPASLRGNHAFTVLGWFKRNGNIVGRSTWGFGGDASGQGFTSYNAGTANEISLDLWGFATYSSQQTYSPTTWKHCAWTYNGSGFSTSNVTIYVDGVAYTGGSLAVRRGGSTTYTPAINGNGIVIGKSSIAEAMWGSPIVSVFQVYDRVLSQAEINAIYNATRSRFL